MRLKESSWAVIKDARAVASSRSSSSSVELGGINSTYFNVAGLDADTAIACYTVMEASGLRCRVFQSDGTIGGELDITTSGDVKAVRVVPMESAGFSTGALLCHETGCTEKSGCMDATASPFHQPDAGTD